MEQNTVIISTEEYNRLREGCSKWLKQDNIDKLQDHLNEEKWKQWYEEQLEDIVNKLVTKGTHKIVYLGQAPDHILYPFSARHIYEIVTIGTDASILQVPEKPKQKIPLWQYALYMFAAQVFLIYLFKAGYDNDLLWLFR